MTLPPSTPLQQAVSCAFSCFHEAHEHLDSDQWSAYVAVLVELATREAARLAVGEAIRAAREMDP